MGRRCPGPCCRNVECSWPDLCCCAGFLKPSLPPALPLPQRERAAAAGQLSEAKQRILALSDQLTAERSQTAALKAQATEAAAQLAEANTRYRMVLEQLQEERARSEALQVRPGDLGGAGRAGRFIAAALLLPHAALAVLRFIYH